MSTIFDAVKEKEPILFIGAGFSKCLDLPDWKGLVFDILDICENNEQIKQGYKAQIEEKRKTLLNILDEYENEKRTIYERVIKNKIKIRPGHPNLKRVEKLWEISDKIITTNYDNALEITGNSDKEVIENDANFEMAKLQDTKNYIFNLHGSTKKVESCILFTSDFERLYNGDTLVKSVFENIIKNNVIIFIGFSMGDPYINNIFEKINTIYKGYLKNHYLVTTDNNSDFSKFNLKIANIKNWNEGLDEALNKLIEVRANKKLKIKVPEPPKIALTPYSSINILNIYPQLNTLFTGREKEQELFKNTLANHRVFAIEGLGGFGKTEFAAKCINKFIEHKENIIWLNANEETKFDSFIENIGYGEILKSEIKTPQAIFSSLFNLIERDKKVIFLDNFQAIKSDLFLKFIEYAQLILKESTIIIISKKDITINGTSLYVISISGLEDALDYAKKIRDNEDKFKSISDADLQLLVKHTLEHPLAIKLCIPLLKKGIKVDELIQKLVTYKGQGLAEVEELTKRIFDEVYYHESTTEQERVLLKSISAFNSSIKKEAIDFLLGMDQFVYLSKLQDNFLITSEQDDYKLHPLIKELAYNILENRIEVHTKAASYFLTKRKEDLVVNLEENIFYHLGKSEQWDKVNEEIDLKGRELILKGNYELIKELIEKLRYVKVSNPLFEIFLGEIEEINGHYNAAIEHYKNASLQNLNIEVKAEGNLKLGEIFYYKGEVNKSFEKFNDVLEISENEGFEKLEVKSLNNLGDISEFTGKHAEAIEFHTRSLNIAKRINYLQGIAICMGSLGGVFESQGKYEKAIEFHTDSLEIEREIGHLQGISGSLNSLGSVFESQGKYEKAIKYHTDSLTIARAIGHEQGIATSLGNIGNVFELQGKYEEAIEYHKECLAILVKIGYQQGVATSLGNLGSVFELQGKYEESFKYHNESLKVNKKIGHPRGIAISLGNIGNIFYSQGKCEKAIEFHNEGLQIQREIGHRRGIAATLANLGDIFHFQGKYEEAVKYHEESLTIKKAIGHRQGIAASLNSFGNISQSRGEYEEAIRYYEESLAILVEIGYQQGIAASLINIGKIFNYQGKQQNAINFYRKSLVIARQIGHRQNIAASLAGLGDIFFSQRKYEEAIKYHEESLAIKRAIGNRQGIAASLNSFGNIFRFKGKYIEAIKYHEESLTILREIGHKQGIAASLINFGNNFQSQGKQEEAIKFYDESLTISREIGHREGIAASLTSLGNISFFQDKYEEAIKFYNESLVIVKQIGYQRGIASALHNLGCLYLKRGNLNFEIALNHFFNAIVILRKIGVPETNTLSKINYIRTQYLKDKFKSLAYEIYNDFSEEDKAFIDIRSICREPLKSTKPSLNSQCFCGSGKKYKRCHGLS